VFVKSAPSRFAPHRLALLKSAPTSFAPLRFANDSWIPINFRPDRLELATSPHRTYGVVILDYLIARFDFKVFKYRALAIFLLL
jgi:hypothetical protein